MTQATRRGGPAGKTLTDVSTWEDDRIRGGIRIMMYLRLNRRARWARHRMACASCRSWRASETDQPSCSPGAAALAGVREATAAAAALRRQLEPKPEPAETLW
jgi:hypothetical protein